MAPERAGPPPPEAPARAVLDTNVFVAAGFAPASASARLLAEAAAGRLALVWCPATRAETAAVLTRIPPLSWPAAAPLFAESGRVDAALDLAGVGFVADRADRVFAALSRAAGAPLVSSDSDLLTHPDRLDVWAPGAFLRALAPAAGGAG